MMKKETQNIPTWTIQCKYPTFSSAETEYLVDAHTEGLKEYGHPELAIVVTIPEETIGEILNTLGTRIANGECFCIPGIYENILQDDFPVRVVRTEYGKENEMSVLIFPDEKRRLPEDVGCQEPYRWQLEYLRRIKEDYVHSGSLFKGN